MSRSASRSSPAGGSAKRGAPSSSTASSSSTIKNRAQGMSSPRKPSASSSLLSSPVLNPDLLESQGLLDADESGFLTSAGDLGHELADLSLDATMTTKSKPRRSTQSRKSQSPSKPRGGRPSWGPKSSPVKGNIRLLDGLHIEDSPKRSSAAKKERTLGAMSYGGVKGTQKARQSIFARPQQSSSTAASPGTRRTRTSVGGGDDDSFYKDGDMAGSSGSVKMRVSDIESKRTNGKGSIRDAARSITGASEQLDVQLAEVKRVNAVFEAYEQMLLDSTGQLDDFSTRIGETNALLDSYIDLMRQTERTYQLLMDSDWKGVTEDQSAHALAMELAEREERRRQEEEEEAVRQAAIRAQEAEVAKLAASMAKEQQQRRGIPNRAGTRPSTLPSSARGAARAGSGIPARSASSTGPAKGRATQADRVVSSTSSRTVSGGSGVSRSVSGGPALNNRYDSVRSSGYGPNR